MSVGTKPSTKTECDYLNGWIKNGHIHKNLTESGEAQKYSWGTNKKKKKVQNSVYEERSRTCRPGSEVGDGLVYEESSDI